MQNWRFNYYRKLFDKLKINLPITNSGDIDLDFINAAIKNEEKEKTAYEEATSQGKRKGRKGDKYYTD